MYFNFAIIIDRVICAQKNTGLGSVRASHAHSVQGGGLLFAFRPQDIVIKQFLHS